VLSVQDVVVPAAQSVAVQAPDGLAAPNAGGLAAHDVIVMARTLLPTAPPLAVEYDVPVVDVQR
jgi:hypothetical protein